MIHTGLDDLQIVKSIAVKVIKEVGSRFDKSHNRKSMVYFAGCMMHDAINVMFQWYFVLFAG